jgi:hypothetical protein
MLVWLNEMTPHRIIDASFFVYIYSCSTEVFFNSTLNLIYLISSSMAHELENKLEEEQVRSIGELQKLSILLTLVTTIFLTGLIIITSSSTPAVDARDSLYSMMASFVFFLCLTFMS